VGARGVPMSNDLVIRLCDEKALLVAELETLRSVHADAQAELVKLKAELEQLKQATACSSPGYNTPGGPGGPG
jgi:capsule polysaccharide export protein KpsE/RkpR